MSINRFLTVLGIVVPIGALGLYFAAFHAGLSSDQTDWGSFGSYFAGICAGVNILLLFITLRRQNKQMELVRENSAFNSAQQLESQALNLEGKQPLDALMAWMSAFKRYRQSGNTDNAKTVMENMIGLIGEKIYDFSEQILKVEKNDISPRTRKTVVSALDGFVQFLKLIKDDENIKTFSDLRDKIKKI